MSKKAFVILLVVVAAIIAVALFLFAPSGLVF